MCFFRLSLLFALSYLVLDIAIVYFFSELYQFWGFSGRVGEERCFFTIPTAYYLTYNAQSKYYNCPENKIKLLYLMYALWILFFNCLSSAKFLFYSQLNLYFTSIAYSMLIQLTVLFAVIKSPLDRD